MNRVNPLNKKQQSALVAFLCIAMGAPILLGGATSFAWLPSWSGGAIALCALSGALLLFWRSGALRLRFLALMVAAVAVATAAGYLLGGRA